MHCPLAVDPSVAQMDARRIGHGASLGPGQMVSFVPGQVANGPWAWEACWDDGGWGNCNPLSVGLVYQAPVSADTWSRTGKPPVEARGSAETPLT